MADGRGGWQMAEADDRGEWRMTDADGRWRWEAYSFLNPPSASVICHPPSESAIRHPRPGRPITTDLSGKERPVKTARILIVLGLALAAAPSRAEGPGFASVTELLDAHDRAVVRDLKTYLA